MSNTGCLLSALSWMLYVSNKYSKIEREPGRKERTVFFGVYSILMSVLTAGLFVLCAWGIFAMVESINENGLAVFIWFLFIIGLAVGMLVLLIENIMGGLIAIIYQFRCNRRPIGYIAIVVYIIATAGMIVGTIYVSGILGIN